MALASVASEAKWYSDSQPIMGTQVSLTFWFDDEAAAKEIQTAVMGEFHRIDQAFSPYKEASELSRLNRLASAKALPVSDEFAFLIDKSLYYGKVSDGAFDITFASVGRYYDYRNKKKPKGEVRKSLLPAINYRHVEFDKTTNVVKFARPDVYVDLGGIAKGHAVDTASKVLADAGVRHAAVSAGGDSRVIGDKRGRPWMIGIKNPRQQPGEPDTLTRIPLSDAAVSTSGDYERFFIDDDTGERVHHILNPKTGTSAEGVVSVTVIGDRGVDTDPLSTTVFVLGVEKGLALIERFPGIDCVIIDDQGRAHFSSGLVDPTVN